MCCRIRRIARGATLSTMETPMDADWSQVYESIRRALDERAERITKLEWERDGLKADRDNYQGENIRLERDLDERTRQVAQLQDDLTDARKRGEACAAKVEPAPVKESRYNPPPPESLVGALQDRVCETSGKLISASPIVPKAERVTLYVVAHPNGLMWLSDGSGSLPIGQKRYALDARVVREGGAA